MSEPIFSHINEIISIVHGEVCTSQQMEFLYKLSYETKGTGEIVEIGTNIGKTAIALAYGQKVKKGKPIHSIDIYEHPDIVKNLELGGVSDYVNRIVLPSHKIAGKWDKLIELLWIDGDHSYKGVCSDIKNWTPFVIPGGLIALHDYPGHRNSLEVWKGVKKYFLRYPYRYRVISDREAGSIIVFRKLPYNPQKIKIGKKIKNNIYWLYRNLRSIAVHYFPGLAQSIKKLLSTRTKK